MYNRTSMCRIKINTESGLKHMAEEKRPPKQPEISIIVPVYKVEKYLNACIDSLLAQTFADFEVILVDDGSPDTCPALCDAAAAKDSRIRVIHKPNGGVSTARNAGLAAARGSWIGFVDPDDAVDSTYYEKMLHAAQQAGAELAVCNVLYLEADGTKSGYQEQPLRDEVLTREEAIQRMRLTPFDHVTTRLHRRELFEGVRFPEGKNYEDAFTTPVILERVTAVACVEEKIYHYRLNPEGIMRSKASLKNFDEIDANYAMLRCELKHGQKDAAFLQYALMKHMLRTTQSRLPQQDRNGPRAQQAQACLRRARAEIKASGAYTLRNMLETALCFAAPQRYYAYKYHRKPARKENTL